VINPITTCERCNARGVHCEKHHLILRSTGGLDGPIGYVCMQCHREIHDHVGDWRDWILRPGETKERAIDF
jgi:hypothetical protein